MAMDSTRLIGKGWVQGVALVMIFGFFVMGILAYRTYAASMPMPDKVVQMVQKTWAAEIKGANGPLWKTASN